MSPDVIVDPVKPPGYPVAMIDRASGHPEGHGGALRCAAWCLLPLGLALGGCGSTSHSTEGCTKDTDCRAPRVCTAGVCVDPPATAEPTHAPVASQGQPTPPATATPRPTTAPATPQDTGPRLLAAGEQAELNKVLSRFDVDYQQTFHVALNGFGECVLASTIFKENQVGDLLVVDGGKTYPLPQSADTKSWKRDKVKGIWFGKLDKDDLTDVIAIADYMTGIGPTGAKPFPVVFYYFASGPRTFRLDEELGRKATAKHITSLSAARELATGPAEAGAQCSGQDANSEQPCSLKNGLTGWCKGGVCKAVCPAGYSYDPLDTQCHQPRDCKPSTNPDGSLKPVKTAKCNECIGSVCFDAAATRAMPN